MIVNSRNILERESPRGKKAVPKAWFWLMLFLLAIILGFLWQNRAQITQPKNNQNIEKLSSWLAVPKLSIYFDFQSAFKTLRLQFEAEIVEMEMSLRELGLNAAETIFDKAIGRLAGISQKIFENLKKVFDNLRNAL